MVVFLLQTLYNLYLLGVGAQAKGRGLHGLPCVPPQQKILYETHPPGGWVHIYTFGTCSTASTKGCAYYVHNYGYNK